MQHWILGAYNAINIIDDKLPIGKSLHKLVNNAKYDDYLFIFGTVVAQEVVNPSNKSTILTFNASPVLKGGPNGQSWLVFKNFVSEIDFIEYRNDTVVDPYDVGIEKYSKLPKAWSDLFYNHGWEIVSDYPILRVDGLLIGLEICLDHSEGILAKINMPVDVHVIISAGMDIAYGPSTVKTGGNVFLVDGRSNTQFGLKVSSISSDTFDFFSGYSSIFLNTLPSQIARLVSW